MIDRMFNWLDWSCDAFLKLVVVMLFGACGIYLAVAGGTFGLCIFLVLVSFLRWAFSDTSTVTAHEEDV